MENKRVATQEEFKEFLERQIEKEENEPVLYNKFMSYPTKGSISISRACEGRVWQAYLRGRYIASSKTREGLIEKLISYFGNLPELK